MNNENKELLNNDVEINVSEEEITLAPPVELFDEAKEIAQSTLSDEKFPFALQYDSNQKEFLLSMLEAVGAIVEDDDDDGYTCLYDFGNLSGGAVKAFMRLISFHTTHGGHTSAIRACELMGLEWEGDK